MFKFLEKFVNKTKKEGVRPFGSSVGWIKKTEDVNFKTPHEMMRMAMYVYRNFPIVYSAITDRALLLTGGQLVVRGKNKEDVEYLQQIVDELIDPLRIIQLARLYLVTGNVPIEKIRDDDGFIVNFDPYPFPQHFYINDDYYSAIYERNEKFMGLKVEERRIEDKYLAEVDVVIGDVKYNGRVLKPSWYTVYYSPFSRAPTTVIYAIPLRDKDYYYVTSPDKAWGYYGFSFLMTTYKYYQAIEKIIDNIIYISEKRAIGKKIISVKNPNNTPATAEDVKILAELLQQQDNIIFNKEISITDLSYQGTWDSMINEMDYLRKMVIGGLIPNVLTPWANEVNRSTAREVIRVFEKQLDVMKRELLGFFNRVLLPNLRKKYKIHSKVWFDFKRIKISSLADEFGDVADLYREGLLNKKEVLEMLDLPFNEEDLKQEEEREIEKVRKDLKNRKRDEGDENEL